MSPRESSSAKKTDSPATFEAGLERLQALVSELEAGDVPLEESLKAFEEGRKLIQFCEQKLQTAEASLKELGTEADAALRGDRNAERS